MDGRRIEGERKKTGGGQVEVDFECLCERDLRIAHLIPPASYKGIAGSKDDDVNRKTKETEDAPQAKEVSKAEKQTKEDVNESIPFKKIDSDLSFEPPVRLLQKLESDLSLARNIFFLYTI